jgi:predicted transcriptional regulator
MNTQKSIRISQRTIERIDILSRMTRRTKGGIVEYGVDLLWEEENKIRQSKGLPSLDEIKANPEMVEA